MTGFKIQILVSVRCFVINICRIFDLCLKTMIYGIDIEQSLNSLVNWIFWFRILRKLRNLERSSSGFSKKINQQSSHLTIFFNNVYDIHLSFSIFDTKLLLNIILLKHCWLEPFLFPLRLPWFVCRNPHQNETCYFPN